MRTFRAVFLISMFQVHKNWLQGALRPEKEADRSSIVRFFGLMCETVRYERHEANEVLYYPDDIGTCWYILLSGSVFIKESMFLPRSSFGKRSAGSFRRGCECIVLEPSEMIVVDYMDENEEYFQRQASHRQSRRRFRKINQKGERQTIIDTVEPYPVGKPPLPRGYHTECTKPQVL
uniref:Rap guanine nucleotide exchange factor 6-like n=1 Tax=Castor canadensis TaxID=51338 RepID=A0A8B7UV73_CASCN|nr:rap guanine nucleotide exchange factor 6-like [Castor canadensis]